MKKPMKKITAELSFKADIIEYHLRIEDYQGWIYENKTKNLKVEIEHKLIVFKNVNFETIKEKIIK